MTSVTSRTTTVTDPTGAGRRAASSAGDHDLAKDYDPDSYFRMLGLWTERYPSYVPDFKDARDIGEEGAMIIVESSDGMAPGPASGVMIYRVAG